METNAQTITTMGIISDEVYKDIYFENKPIIEIEPLKANGKTYKVLDHTPTSNDGFNALLLHEVGTTNYVIAFGGTQGYVDITEDAIIGLNNYSSQFEQAKAWVKNIIDTNDDISESNLTLTGHSLGGILTQAVGATYKIQGYAYNAYGVDRLLSMPSLPSGGNLVLDTIAGIIHSGIYKIFSAFGLEAPNTAWAKENILNVQYFDDGIFNGDPLSNLATDLTSKHLGSFLAVYGQNLNAGDGHKMPNLNTAIQNYNDILKSFSSKDYTNLTDAYVLVGYERAEEIFNKLDIKNASNLSFDFFINKTPNQLNQTNKADLYALINLNPFAIKGNLPAYDDINPDDYSNTYLEKRSEMLYYTMHPESKNTGDGTYYQDETSDVHTQDKLMVNYANGKSSYVEFGTDGKDDMVGFNNDDFLFGGKGDDTLVGQGGNDHLEGGAGHDTYITANGDTIMDSDHSGKVYLNGRWLLGGKLIAGESNKYQGDYGEIYTLDTIQDTLHVELNDESITIKNYDEEKQSLGISLGKEIEVTVGDSMVYEDVGMMRVYVSINHTLDKDITFAMMSIQTSATESEDYKGFGENNKPLGQAVIKAGQTVGYIDIPIINDEIIEENETFNIVALPDSSLDTNQYPLSIKYNGDDLAKVTFTNAGIGTIQDDDSNQLKDVIITIDDASIYEDEQTMTFVVRSNAVDIGSIMQLSITQENDIIELNEKNNTIIESESGDDTLNGGKIENIKLSKVLYVNRTQKLKGVA